ncbi:aminodeoxychorismate lyase [Marinomonas agarivorans]|nr:aminodeoxychorismate lyase [Marinomonas agarivorans]
MKECYVDWFVNYEQQRSLSINDRSISYGDGVFETLLICNGVIQRKQLHFQRLTKGLHKLKFSISTTSLERLFGFIQSQCDRTKAHQGVKIIISRGEGGRGYWPSGDLTPSFLIGFFDYTVDRNLLSQGVMIDNALSRSTINRQLAGIKHLNRLENVLAKQALDIDCYDAVMKDDDDFLTECIQSNIFWVKNNVLYTPILNRSGVQGTVRNDIIHRAASLGVHTCIGHYKIACLHNADEVFLCNSLIGIMPVTAIKNTVDYKIGTYTTLLQQHI